jgi:hypothetical protein
MSDRFLACGSRNDLLNQFTANALAIPVAAGPAEATALGNVAAQAIALSRLPDLAAARSIIAASFPPRIFLPARAKGDLGCRQRSFHSALPYLVKPCSFVSRFISELRGSLNHVS